MAETNGVILTVVLTLCAVLVGILIVVCIKLVNTTNKINAILDDVQIKLNSVNGVFSAVDGVTNAISTVGESIVSKALLVIDKIFKRGKED